MILSFGSCELLDIYTQVLCGHSFPVIGLHHAGMGLFYKERPQWEPLVSSHSEQMGIVIAFWTGLFPGALMARDHDFGGSV